MKKQHGGKREGAGRPGVPESSKKITTTISLPQWLLTRLDEIGGTRSAKVEKAIVHYFDIAEENK